MYLDPMRLTTYSLDPLGQKLHQRVHHWGIVTDMVRSTGTRAAHRHPCFEIVFVHMGAALWYIEGRPFVLVPGDILVFCARSLHSSRPIHTGYVRTGIHFLRDAVPEKAAEQLLQEEMLPRHVSVPPLNMSRLFDYFQRLRNLTRCPGQHGAAKQLLGRILEELDRVAQATRQTETVHEIVHEAVNYMLSYPQKEESLTDLAARFYVSEGHLCQLFRTYLRCSPKKLWQLIKIEHLCSTMRLMHLTIPELADEAGFESRRGFERAFRKIKGMPVREYRSLLQETSGFLASG